MAARGRRGPTSGNIGGEPYRGFQDYGALAQRTNASYEDRAQQLQSTDNIGDPFRTLKLAANTINRQSPMAPWLQAVSERTGGKGITGGPSRAGSNQLTGVSDQANADSVASAVVGQVRPRAKTKTSSLADDPQWWMQSNGPFAPAANSLPASLRPFFAGSR